DDSDNCAPPPGAPAAREILPRALPPGLPGAGRRFGSRRCRRRFGRGLTVADRDHDAFAVEALALAEGNLSGYPVEIDRAGRIARGKLVGETKRVDAEGVEALQRHVAEICA